MLVGHVIAFQKTVTFHMIKQGVLGMMRYPTVATCLRAHLLIFFGQSLDS
jgi:hypothetical protein